MVVDSILQFMSQMDETVLALMDDYDDFYMIMKNNRGIHPIDLQKSIKRLYRSNKIRKSKYIRIMASASNTNIHGFEDMPDVLPVPHILDYDWRFSRQGLEYMANAVKKIIKKKNAVIVFLELQHYLDIAIISLFYMQNWYWWILMRTSTLSELTQIVHYVLTVI